MKRRIVLILIIVGVLGTGVVVAWWWTHRNTGEKLLTRAELALRAENYERALELGRSYEQDSPDDWRGPFVQARAHISLGQYDEARDALAKAAEIAPDEVTIPMARADTFAHPARRSLTSAQADLPPDVLRHAIGQFSQARDVLAGISAPDGTAAPDVAEALGLVEAELGSAQDALSRRLKKDADIAQTAGATDQANAKSKESADARKAAERHFAEAAKVLLVVVQQDAKASADTEAKPHERAANVLVRLCMDTGDRKTLAAAHEAVLSLKSPPPLAAAMLVTSDLASSDVEARSPAERQALLAACKKLDDILERHPKHPNTSEIKLTRAQLALRLGDYETVETICNGVLETDARNARARLMLAAALINRGGAARAERDLFALKTQFPHVAQAHFAYAGAAMKSGKIELAKEALRKTTELEPNHAGARLLLADILLSGGFSEEAFSEAEVLFHAHQDMPEAVAKFTQTAGKTGNRRAVDDVRDALIAAEAALQLPEAPPQASDDLKRFCETLQKFAKAAKAIWPAGEVNQVMDEADKAFEGALKVITSGQPDTARTELTEGLVTRLRPYAEMIFARPVAKWLAVGDGYVELGVWAARRGEQDPTKQAAAAAKASWQQAIRMKPDTLVERLPAAQAMLRLGQAPEAEKALKGIVNDYKDAPDAHFQLGRFYAGVGRASQAIEAYKVAVTWAPRDARYRFALAGALFDVGLLEEASLEVKAVLEMDPSLEPARQLATRIALLRGEPVEEAVGGKQEGLSLAATYLNHGKPDQCVEICQAALKENEDDLQARWLLGQAYWVLDQVDKCVEQWKKVLTASPDEAAIYRELARVLSRDKTPQEVEKELLAVAGARSELVDCALGWLFRQQGKHEAAAEAYGRAAGRADALPDTRNFARLDRANCLAMAGHVDRAIVELDQMPQQDPWRDQVLIRKTAILAAAGRSDEAVPILLLLQNKAVQAKNIQYLIRVGNTYIQIRQPEKALAVADELDRLSPKEPQSCLLRATALNALGRRSEAVESCRAAVAREPVSVRLRLILAAALDAEGKLDEALEALAELEARGEAAETQALYQQGLLFARWGLHKQAVERLGALAGKGDVVGPELRLALGQALARLGQADKAREELEKISRYAPHYVMAQQVLAGLATADDEKLAILRQVEADRPGRSTIVHQRMTILKQAGRIDDAVKEYQSFADRLPEADAPPDVLTVFAVHIMLGKGDYQGAAALSEQAAKKTLKPLWNRLALLLLMDDQPGKAEGLLPEVEDAQLLDTLLGVCLAARSGAPAEKWADRLAAIEQRLTHAEPPRTMPPAYKVLATVATKGTMRDDQMAEFTGKDLLGFAAMRELIASAKSDPDIRAEAATLLKSTLARDLGLTDVARAWALQALKARPTSQWAAVLAASRLTEPAALREVLGILKPGDCMIARMIQASALEAEGEHEKAAQIYRLVAEAEKGNLQSVMHQAVAIERAGQPEKALPLYRQVWEKDQDPTAANNAAYIVSELYPKDAAKLAEAATWADAAVKAAPRTAAYRDTLGWIAYLQGRNDEARTELRRAVKGLPDSPEVHYHLGMVEGKAGSKPLARWHLEAAVSLGENLTSKGQDVPDATGDAVRLAREALGKLGGAQE
ncbi:MAG TPA: tetratricopeptide repeat protein [Phycisphaerae bacterium]|nr:tetratricopeptide repeat protein [Phycisphaerae bacterium]